ncbi:MAG: methyltransferase domain-containing protein [Candidatus Electrothrix sp. AR3]|nr:methyltransferase domain-containing protein [Candidatus Electrothrix sp. AR3]
MYNRSQSIDMNIKDIQTYYESCHKDYKRVWHLDRCMAMHMGFWNEETTRLRDALINENKVLAEQAAITSTDRVLDAGCGVGGSSIFLAQQYGCHVTGITLSRVQVKQAQQYAAAHNVQERTTFFVADYIQVPYPEASFDVIWAIESVCHAENKKDFLQEAYRLLKKGGRLIIADGFQAKHSLTQKETTLLKKSFSGWGVDALEHNALFHDSLKELNFKNINEQDATSLIYRSSRILFIVSFPGFIVHLFERMLKKRGAIEQKNIASTFHQFLSLRKGLWKYKIFYAEK